MSAEYFKVAQLLLDRMLKFVQARYDSNQLTPKFRFILQQSCYKGKDVGLLNLEFNKLLIAKDVAAIAKYPIKLAVCVISSWCNTF
jgi:hypothetical protein